MKDGEFDRLRIPLDDGRVPDGARARTRTTTGSTPQQRLGVAASPAQLAAGSAILAGLILLGVAALRRRRGSGPREAGGRADDAGRTADRHPALAR